MKKILAVIICLAVALSLSGCAFLPVDDLSSTAPPKEALSNEIQVPQSTATDKITLNEEVFADLGTTYGDLVKKYGAETNRDYCEGGLYCEFENGLGKYFIDFKEYDVIADDDKCHVITLNAKYIFDNDKLSKKIAISDLADALGSEIYTDFNEMRGKGYFSVVKNEYNGFTIRFSTDDEKFIDENSYFDIVLYISGSTNN